MSTEKTIIFALCISVAFIFGIVTAILIAHAILNWRPAPAQTPNPQGQLV